ncbi:lipoyl synthase [Thiohalorhabdus sp.]|uniref:lipoyl synthase n=1 Tax=Thiohalorhabdus sp. TaxID=3094134 RepID=UPI002FC3DE60
MTEPLKFHPNPSAPDPEAHGEASDGHTGPNATRMPPWIRYALGDARNSEYSRTAAAVHERELVTICEEGNCPNRGECWSRGTATFMILGDTCTRACGFCSVKTGKPGTAPDYGEAEKVADAAQAMGLSYVVLTSVNRDDLADGGAGLFAATVNGLRARRSGIGVELLTPDFRKVVDAAVAEIAPTAPLVWGHNVETVPRLYKPVRPGSDYQRSLYVLERAAQLPQVEAKSSLMLGLGETEEEVIEVMRDLHSVGVTRLALGQYLRPSRDKLPVQEYIHPDRFAALEQAGRDLGFTWIKAGPLVRSSYHAEEEQG